MTDNLTALDSWVGELLPKLTPAQRRGVLRVIVRDLRRSQAARIAKQTNPDGTPFEPRKRATGKRPPARAGAGRVRRQAMFMKLRTTRFMTIAATADGGTVGFAGRVAQIAAVHQHGERAPVAPGGPEYRYPRRVLLGFTEPERGMIRDHYLKHLSSR
ncbi:phage virion morphogenesis protein [Burkholderia pseudomallei]|uniref:phage virion morphogenesis protein n=1 Tax=Burkholderia pseudomallei TaxID=28450 RepID=UPI0009780562|nr:phage virion morphogenesis protein [Burkholderia pseudomallei]OMY79970.1 phage tail protein [Burkholderia pseudomallei]